MPLEKDWDWLIHRYLEGAAGEDEARALNDALRTDPRARRRLAEAAFDGAQLRDLLAAAGVEAPPATRRPARRSAPLLPLTAAALFVAGVGAAILFRPETPPAIQPPLAGPRAGRTVTLSQGHARYSVSPAESELTVLTPGGSVVASDAEFAVEIRRLDRRREESRPSVQLAVTVDRGRVRVESGGAPSVVIAGQKRTFPEPERRATSKSGFVGNVRATVISKGESQVRIRIDRVLRADRLSRALDAHLLEGDEVTVGPGRSRNFAALIGPLEIGRVYELGLRASEGPVYTFLEPSSDPPPERREGERDSEPRRPREGDRPDSNPPPERKDSGDRR